MPRVQQVSTITRTAQQVEDGEYGGKRGERPPVIVRTPSQVPPWVVEALRSGVRRIVVSNDDGSETGFTFTDSPVGTYP